MSKIIFLCFLLILLFIQIFFKKKKEDFIKVKKRNCFFVISKEVTHNMFNFYSNIITKDLFFITDLESSVKSKNVYYYDSNLIEHKGFVNTHNIIKTTSLDKLFYHLSKSNILKKYDYVWIIEDDCYLNKNSFNKFINNYDSINNDLILFGWYKNYNTDSNKWPSWDKNSIKLNNNSFFKKENLRAAITQFCRLSPKIINNILKLRNKFNQFCYHEIEFASICEENNLSMKVENKKEVKLSPFVIKGFSDKKKKELDNSSIVVLHPKKLWYDEK